MCTCKVTKAQTLWEVEATADTLSTMVLYLDGLHQATLLPMAKFAYNNTMNATTGVSPFFPNKGYHLEFTADTQVKTSLAEVQVFVADLECVQAELKENITQAQERYQKNADKHRLE